MPQAKNNKNQNGNKREQILHAAVEKFLEKDFYQVTVTEIAELAGVGKGTVYEYFSSKEELFKESFSYCAGLYLQTFKINFTSPHSARAAMEEIVVNHLKLIKENRNKLHLLFNERPQNLKELQTWILEQRRELINELSGLLSEGIKLGEMRSDLNVEMAARLFLALNQQVLGEMVLLDNIAVEEAQLKELLDLYWNGIGKSSLWQGH